MAEHTGHPPRTSRRTRQGQAVLDVVLGSENFRSAQDIHAQLRASGEVRRARTVQAHDQLSPQELQIARAVGRGLNNVEAAAALFVSRKTVEAHLTRAYRKLGVRSRTELTRLLLAYDASDLSIRRPRQCAARQPTRRLRRTTRGPSRGSGVWMTCRCRTRGSRSPQAWPPPRDGART